MVLGRLNWLAKPHSPDGSPTMEYRDSNQAMGIPACCNIENARNTSVELWADTINGTWPLKHHRVRKALPTQRFEALLLTNQAYRSLNALPLQTQVVTNCIHQKSGCAPGPVVNVLVSGVLAQARLLGHLDTYISLMLGV